MPRWMSRNVAASSSFESLGGVYDVLPTSLHGIQLGQRNGSDHTWLQLLFDVNGVREVSGLLVKLGEK